MILKDRCVVKRAHGRTFNGGTRVCLGFALDRDRLWIHAGRWTYWIDTRKSATS